MKAVTASKQFNLGVYPNPSTFQNTTITLDAAKNKLFELCICNELGQTLCSNIINTGNNASFTWQLSELLNGYPASGTYFIKLTSETESIVKKLVLTTY